MDQSVPKTKNMPFAQDTIIPGSETIDKFALQPSLRRQSTEQGTVTQNMLPACRARHCIGLLGAPFISARRQHCTGKNSDMPVLWRQLVFSGKGQKGGGNDAECEGVEVLHKSNTNANSLNTFDRLSNPSPPRRHLATFHLLIPSEHNSHFLTSSDAKKGQQLMVSAPGPASSWPEKDKYSGQNRQSQAKTASLTVVRSSAVSVHWSDRGPSFLGFAESPSCHWQTSVRSHHYHSLFHSVTELANICQ